MDKIQQDLFRIERAIRLIRGDKVILDEDLAELYGVETKNLVKAVKRNLDRFPADFMFQLTNHEFTDLWFQSGTASQWGGRRTAPYAFSEQGVAMLSSVLHSVRAIQVNIEIMVLAGGRMLFRHFSCLLTLFWWFSATASATEHQAMLPQVYANHVDVRGWLMSEKLDGVRGYWDGRRLYSKNGYPFHPPAEFTQGLPSFPLEGEIWGGRRTFEQTAAVVQRFRDDAGWLKLKFAIFDVPEAGKPFMERITKASEWFAAYPSVYAFVIPQIPVHDRAHLQKELQRVESLGGEGLIVRNPAAFYQGGRSAEILKVKSFQDAEAVVIAHLPGTGRNSGRLGSLLAQLPDGTQFRIGTGLSDAERDNPPAIGETISFKYYGYYPSGIPKFPSFLRIRQDGGL